MSKTILNRPVGHPAPKPAAKPPACAFKAAINKGDHGGAINILLAKLDESTDQINDLVNQVSAKQHTINQFCGLISLAHSMGKL
jgi:hypothetical protein